MSYSRKFQPLATSTPNGKCVTPSADLEAAMNKHVAEDKVEMIWSSGREERPVNRRVLSSGGLLTEEEKILLFKICNGRPVT